MLEAHYSVHCIRAQRVCIYLPCAFLHVCVHARCSQLYPAVLASLLICSVTVCQGRCFKRAQGLFQISLADVSHPCHVSSFFSLPPHTHSIQFILSESNRLPSDYLKNVSPFLSSRHHPHLSDHMRGRRVWHHHPILYYPLTRTLCSLKCIPFSWISS